MPTGPRSASWLADRSQQGELSKEEELMEEELMTEENRIRLDWRTILPALIALIVCGGVLGWAAEQSTDSLLCESKSRVVINESEAGAVVYCS